MILYKGLTQVYSQKQPRLHFGESFTLHLHYTHSYLVPLYPDCYRCKRRILASNQAGGIKSEPRPLKWWMGDSPLHHLRTQFLLFNEVNSLGASETQLFTAADTHLYTNTSLLSADHPPQSSVWSAHTHVVTFCLHTVHGNNMLSENNTQMPTLMHHRAHTRTRTHTHTTAPHEFTASAYILIIMDLIAHRWGKETPDVLTAGTLTHTHTYTHTLTHRLTCCLTIIAAL